MGYLIQDILSVMTQPRPYFPIINRFTKNASSTVLLCYLLGKQHEWEWVGYTSDKIYDEIGMNYQEQVKARKRLNVMGLLHEEYDRLHNILYLRIHQDNLATILSHEIHPEDFEHWEDENETN